MRNQNSHKKINNNKIRKSMMHLNKMMIRNYNQKHQLLLNLIWNCWKEVRNWNYQRIKNKRNKKILLNSRSNKVIDRFWSLICSRRVIRLLRRGVIIRRKLLLRKLIGIIRIRIRILRRIRRRVARVWVLLLNLR